MRCRTMTPRRPVKRVCFLANCLTALHAATRRHRLNGCGRLKHCKGEAVFTLAILQKSCIPNCTDWEDEERQEERAEAIADMPEPVRITYPLRDHLKATRPDSPRPGLAMILRAAREADADKVHSMVKALCKVFDKQIKGMSGNCPPSFWDWPDDYFDQFDSHALM